METVKCILTGQDKTPGGVIGIENGGTGAVSAPSAINNLTRGLSEETTIADEDYIPFSDSDSSGIGKKITGANLKDSLGINDIKAKANAALPKSGGTMTGNLNMGGYNIANALNLGITSSAEAVGLTANSISSSIGVSEWKNDSDKDTVLKRLVGVKDPKYAHDAANKQYVDSEIATAGSAYLPLAGGNMTGALNMAGKAVTGASYYSINSTSDAVQLTSSLSSSSVGLSPYTSVNDKVSYLKRIVGVADPSTSHDAVNQLYVDRGIVRNAKWNVSVLDADKIISGRILSFTSSPPNNIAYFGCFIIIDESTTSKTITAGNGSKYYNCVISISDGNAFRGGTFYNCTILGSGSTLFAQATCYNCRRQSSVSINNVGTTAFVDM